MSAEQGSTPIPDENEPRPISPVEPSVLGWIEDTLGERLLAYILGCTVEELPALRCGETELSTKQCEVVDTFLAVRAKIPTELDDLNTKLTIRNFVTQITGESKSVARTLREHVVGVEDIPTGRNVLECALIVLAVDAYPACLLPPDPSLPPIIQHIEPRFVSSLLNHPQAGVFSEAALDDSVFKKVFTEQTEGSSGRFGNVMRNTGSGGWLQLIMFPETLLGAAWRGLEPGQLLPDAFARTALDKLHLVRDAFAGKKCTIPARVAFTGALLPPGRKLELRHGLVRPVTETDQRYIPQSLTGAVQSTDAAGVKTVVNYSGDIIFEYQFPYEVKCHPVTDGPPPSSFFEFRQAQNLEQILTRLRFGLVLAAERDQRVQLIPTWRFLDDPLNMGPGASWSDPRQSPGFTAIQLTDAEVDAWSDWYAKLNQAPVSKIELAITRIMRAIAERKEPSDVLVDSVIAWENIFGTKEGEPTFRITMCLARLLKSDPKARRELRTKLGKIYGLRSKVVHGSGVLERAEYSLCQEALDIAIQAVRVLVNERIDLLKLKDGAERSMVLLLEG